MNIVGESESMSVIMKISLYFLLQSPGNHEFDDQVTGFLPFLRDVKFPMVCCNIDDSALPLNERISDHIKKSLIIELNDRKIGIIGYVTPETTVSICKQLLKYRIIKIS